MLTYVSLYKWTEQGIKNVKETTKRGAAATSAAERMGGRIINLFWTQGKYDLVLIAEFPDEDTAMAFNIALAMQGNVTTQTLRAFSAADVDRVLSKVP
ncbi:MAG: GYD domain-containing protein [Chloroflexota bacterium]